MSTSTRATSLILVPLLTAAAAAQDCLPTKALTPPGSYVLADDIGSDVAVKGTHVLVGARYDDNGGKADAGSALLFDAVTGNFVRPLLPGATALVSGECGTSVDVDGGLAVMGAPSYAGGIAKLGTAWVHDVATGSVLFELQPANPGPATGFGRSVAISGDKILVGTPNDFPGSVWVFDATTGQELYKFYDETLPPTMSDHLGWSVDVDGDVAIAGGPRDSQAGQPLAGIARLFDVTTGQELHRLFEPTPVSGGRFGTRVAIDGDRALVTSNSTVYLFDVVTGQVVQSFSSPTVTPFHFSDGIALDGDRVVVGQDRYGVAPGTVWVFDAVTGALERELHAPVPSATDGFGREVDLDGSLLAITAGDPVFFPGEIGRVYLVDLDSDGFEPVGEGLAGVAGVPALDGSGDLSPGGAFTATVSDAAPSAATYLILGFDELSANFMGGVLVPSPDVIKFGPQTNASGGFTVNTNWPAGLSCVGVYAQVWIVDASAPFGFSATNGLLFFGS